jgi:soluble cytochrome b562
MKLTFKPLTVAVLFVTMPFSGVALAEGAKTPLAPAAQAVSAPETEGPQRHFDGAVEAYAKKDYKATVIEIHKAISEMRPEAGRVSSDAKQGLADSVAELDKLAASIEKGAVKDKQSLAEDFARANHALAVAHRAEAAASLARKEYGKAGNELKAAARDLENAAGWASRRAVADASGTVADTKELGEKLASGTTRWTRDEVGRGFEALGHALNELGHKIGAKQQAAPLKLGM